MRNLEFLNDNNKYYIILFLITSIIVALYNPLIGILNFIIYLYISYKSYNQKIEEKKQVIAYIENLSETFDTATKYAIFNMPFPLIIINSEGHINWYNTPFLEMVQEKEGLLDKNINEILLNLDIEALKKEENIKINYEGKEYLVYSNYVKNKKTVRNNEEILLLYLVDNNKYKDLKIKYTDNKSSVAIIYVDNYDDVKSNTPDVNRPILLAEIDRMIRNYFTKYNGLVRKYEKNKYLVVMDNKTLKKLKEKKFDLLDDMRELDMGNKIPITLSMGVSTTEESLNKGQKNASAAIDIALGRGGDQAVLNNRGNYEFFGGKSKAMEKRNKVKARVIGYALKQLINQSDKVFIMGHKNADMDAFGSAIGVLRGTKNMEKEGFIILNELNPSIKNIYEYMTVVQPELKENIIKTSDAKSMITKDSLIVLVDNHKPNFTEAPELLELGEKIVVIDHHRRGAEFVENPVLTYLEPYASSASELVTEILTYMSDDLNLTKFEAEALLSGITVDTKNFSFQTGVRTFEAASTLKRAGADTTSVRQLFRDDYDTFINKADVVKSSKVLYNKIAIGKLDYMAENSLLIAAQSANELLDIKGVEASFVLTIVSDKIHISGRSLGNISVQLILEELGGGGHLTSAGTQIEEVSIEEAEEMLIKSIDKYLKEGEE